MGYVIALQFINDNSFPSFYADVLRRSRQHILVTRDVHSSYTTSSIVPNETAESLRNGLVINTCNIRASSSAVYVDTAPGFKSLKDDALLKKYMEYPLSLVVSKTKMLLP